MKVENSGSRDIFKYMSKSPGGRCASDLAQIFHKYGVNVNPNFASRIIDLALMRETFLVCKEYQQKRRLTEKLALRLEVIRKAYGLSVLDQKSHISSNEQFIERHLFLAIIENAILLNDNFNRSDLRDTTAFNFHLWLINKLIAEQKINKPVETLTFVLEKAHFSAGISSKWASTTIYNRITKASGLIEEFNRLGGCCTPRRIGSWSKVNSLLFVKSISSECENCLNTWKKIFGVEDIDNFELKKSIEKLSQELPELKNNLQLVFEKLAHGSEYSFSLEKMLEYLPRPLIGLAAHAFS